MKIPLHPNLPADTGQQLTEPRKLFEFPEEIPRPTSQSSSSIEPPQQEEQEQKQEQAALSDLPGTPLHPQLPSLGFHSQGTACSSPGPPLS